MADMVTRLYSNFRGVDFRGEEINLLRSPDALNVWKDYKETESIRTRPALKLSEVQTHINGMNTMSENINGIYFYKDEILLHIGSDLWSIKNGIPYGATVEIKPNDAPSCGFVYNDKFYLIDGKNYLQYDGEAFEEVVGYIPTTTIGRKPEGGGTRYEDVNMWSDYRINSFVSDGTAFSFFLDVKNIDKDYMPKVVENGLNLDDTIIKKDGDVYEAADYKVDFKKGKITFKGYAPVHEGTDGQDNIFITFKKAVPEYKKFVTQCTMVQQFDNRVFFSGNPEFPNLIWHCSLNDPSYIGDLDYYKEGTDAAAVKGMVAGNNALWVFREPSDSNTTVFYHTPALDDEYGKIYPSSHSSVTTGCIGKAVNFNDDIVFFSDRGMEGISGDITTEQIVAHRSSLVDRKMIAEKDYKNMQLAEWNGYLLVFIGNRVYLADSRAMFTNENHFEYEWFMWEFSEYKKIKYTVVNDGVLYLVTDKGIFTLTDTSGNVKSYWVTPLDKFNYPNKLKTTNKRGCVAEATGDISVYAKLEDTDFELIGTYENVTDYFVSRIKRKKFKDIQLKFQSNTRFSLETVTLEAFIGGYIKR